MLTGGDSLTRKEPQEVSPGKMSGHTCFLDDNLLHVISKLWNVQFHTKVLCIFEIARSSCAVRKTERSPVLWTCEIQFPSYFLVPSQLSRHPGKESGACEMAESYLVVRWFVQSWKGLEFYYSFWKVLDFFIRSWKVLDPQPCPRQTPFSVKLDYFAQENLANPLCKNL